MKDYGSYILKLHKGLQQQMMVFKLLLHLQSYDTPQQLLQFQTCMQSRACPVMSVSSAYVCPQASTRGTKRPLLRNLTFDMFANVRRECLYCNQCLCVTCRLHHIYTCIYLQIEMYHSRNIVLCIISDENWERRLRLFFSA